MPKVKAIIALRKGKPREEGASEFKKLLVKTKAGKAEKDREEPNKARQIAANFAKPS